jgi:hypothetical protein
MKKPYTVIDCSMTHNTFYLSQLELLEGRKESLNKTKNDEPTIPHFTRPHESVYQDKEGKAFVLKKGTPVYEAAVKQQYTPEHDEDSKLF